MATVNPEGARDWKAVCPCGWAGLGTFQALFQPGGSTRSRRPAWRMSSVKRARARGERALPGTKKLVLEGSQAARSLESPPPGTR